MSGRILYLIESLGVHESRWLKSFQSHDLEVEVRYFDQLEERPLPADQLILTGPLTTAAKHLQMLKKVSYVVMSYAYDILLSAKEKGQSDQSIYELCFHSKGIIFDCEYVRSFFDQSHNLTKPSCVAAWGLQELSSDKVDPEFLQRVTELKTKYEGKTLIFSSRNFSPIHGVLDVVSAFEQISDAVLFIAGGGGLEGEIRERVESSSYHQPVEILGSLTEPELCYAYEQLADIYVSAAHVDGISISLLQAMKANCVLALSAVGGNHDIPPSPFLNLFPAKDVQALIQALKNSQKVLSQLPENSWQDVIKDLGDWEANQNTVVRFLERRYQEVITK